jgi:Flp pilus assembly protein TadD
VLATHAEHPDALHLLGTLEAQQGKLDLGLGLVRRAIARAPHVADFHSTLGRILADQGKLPEAVTAYETALGIATWRR